MQFLHCCGATLLLFMRSNMPIFPVKRFAGRSRPERKDLLCLPALSASSASGSATIRACASCQPLGRPRARRYRHQPLGHPARGLDRLAHTAERRLDHRFRKRPPSGGRFRALSSGPVGLPALRCPAAPSFRHDPKNPSTSSAAGSPAPRPPGRSPARRAGRAARDAARARRPTPTRPTAWPSSSAPIRSAPTIPSTTRSACCTRRCAGSAR